MTYEVTLADETTERIDDADAYQLEGPLTTFFRTPPGRAVVDCWSTRLASYRTADIRRIGLPDTSRQGRRSAPPGCAKHRLSSEASRSRSKRSGERRRRSIAQSSLETRRRALRSL